MPSLISQNIPWQRTLSWSPLTPYSPFFCDCSTGQVEIWKQEVREYEATGQHRLARFLRCILADAKLHREQEEIQHILQGLDKILQEINPTN